MGRQIRVRRRADIAPSTQRRVPSTRLGDISRFSYLSVNSHVGGDERGREREIFAVGVVSRTQEEYRTRFDIGEISDASERARARSENGLVKSGIASWAWRYHRRLNRSRRRSFASL